ncbi:TFIIB-type zinc ribbon-containing protein, partial [Halostagnicola sp. GCM10023243]
MTESTIRTRSDERRSSEREETDEQAEQREECPECGGRVISDAEHAETVCEDCGLVVDEGEIDR